jgi:long-chain acyl-CoA synthetase
LREYNQIPSLILIPLPPPCSVGEGESKALLPEGEGSLGDPWKVHGQRLVRHRRSRESDEDWHLFLRGRRKSVINFGGIKFFPEEVEAVLDAHPDVRESRVSGEPHERWGAVAVAELVPHDVARPLTAAVLGQHCRERLADYKVPARFRLVAALPRTPSGKLRR